MIQSITESNAALVRALEDERYQWRTIDSLSEDLGLTREEVARRLMELNGQLLRSSIPDDLGRSLYTTRRHYQATHTFGERLLAAIADRVA